jgi:transmembrane 9 superfamily protein 2/4
MCRKSYTKEQKEYLSELIDYGYRRLLILDGIPVSTLVNGSRGHIPGFQIGYIDGSRHFLYSHVEFRVKLTVVSSSVYRIIAFDVSSLAANCQGTCGVSIEDGTDFELSYSVKYELTNTTWYTRWDDILSIDYDPKIHWFSISNTLLLLLCLSILIGVILVQTIRKDFSKQSQFLDDEDAPEETGWKLIHGDVFRPPGFPGILAALVGSGVQVAIGGVLVIAVAALGFLAPLNTGSMVTAITVVAIVAAPFGGFVSSKLGKTVSGHVSKCDFFMAATMFLGPELICYLIANWIFVQNGSSAAATLRSFVELFVAVVLLDLALFALGFLVGTRLAPFECPARVNTIARLVPRQPFFLSPIFMAVVGGVIVFASIYVQVYFILQALWTNLSYYYLFGLLLVVVVAMLIIATELSVFAIYLSLSYENHRWWWTAFSVPASIGFVFFGYCVLFMVRIYRPPDASSILIFLIFSFVIALGLSLANGALGFLGAFLFVQKMYGALKME